MQQNCKWGGIGSYSIATLSQYSLAEESQDGVVWELDFEEMTREETARGWCGLEYNA